MPRLPRKLQGTSAQIVEWNAMVDYLASLKPQPSAGTLTEHQIGGVFRKAKPGTTGKGAIKGGSLPVWL